MASPSPLYPMRFATACVNLAVDLIIMAADRFFQMKSGGL